MQIPMGEVSRLLRGNVEPQTSLAARFGETLLEKAVNHMVDANFTGTGVNPIEHLKDTVHVAKELAGINESREKRLVDENESLREAAQKMNTSTSDIVSILGTVLPLIGSKGDSTAMVVEMLNNHHKEMMDLLRENQKNSTSSFLEQIGTDHLRGMMTTDPREEFDRQRDYWAKIFKTEQANNNNIVDFEKWKVQKFVELEEKKVELANQKKQDEEAREERVSARQDRMLQSLARIVSGVADKEGSTPEEIDHALKAGMSLVHCPQCNEEFVLTKPTNHISCPFCRTELDIKQETA